MLYAAVFNNNLCLIFSYQKKNGQIKLVKELNHPESKLKASEYLTSDKPGHFKTSTAGRGAFSPRTSAKEVEHIAFAQQIAKELNQARVENCYEQLAVIAEPHMQGLLIQHLDKKVKSLIVKNIEKDIVQFDTKKIMDLLKSELQFISTLS